MTASKYSFDKVNAVKIIVVNSKNQILLIQEPESYEWMPLHWGLPGGKSLLTESLRDTYQRKMLSEIGISIKPQGLYKIMELLQKDKTILMFIFVVKLTKEVKLGGESKSYKWVGIKEISEMEINDFTEFFNKDLLLEFLTEKRKLTSLYVIETLPYYKYKNNKNYKSWLDSGNKLGK